MELTLLSVTYLLPIYHHHRLLSAPLPECRDSLAARALLAFDIATYVHVPRALPLLVPIRLRSGILRSNQLRLRDYAEKSARINL